MSIRVGVYEVFAYTIPGGLYMIVLAYLILPYLGISVDFRTIDLDFASVVIFAVASFCLGLILNAVCRQTWYRLFHIENTEEVELVAFKKLHPELTIHFSAHDWPTLIAYLRKEGTDIGPAVDQIRALHTMLRNIGFGLAILSGAILIRNPPIRPNVVVVSGLVLALSIIASRESVKYRRWFYSALYETIIAYGMTMSDLYTRNRSGEGPRDTDTPAEQAKDALKPVITTTAQRKIVKGARPASHQSDSGTLPNDTAPD